MLTSPVKTLSLTQADSSWPAQLSSRLGITAPACLWAIGNAEILATHKLGLFCSARCPTDRTLAIYDGMRKLRDEGVTVISGFHSPVEKECLSILLGGRQPIVICLARAMNRIRLPKDWRDPLEAGRILLLSRVEKSRRADKDVARRRNELVAALSDEIFLIHAEPGGAIDRLSHRIDSWRIPRVELTS